MAMEISAARLLAPYFGTSVFIWTNIIGVVLIALSLGYFFGGKYADKHPNLKALLVPTLLAGLIFIIIPWLVKPLASFVTVSTMELSSASMTIFVASLIVASLLFAFPLFLLGMVSPFVIRLFEAEKEDLGKIAGKIFALSTVGSIIGTFLPTLWLIPAIGTRTTMLIFSLMLVALSVFGLLKKKLYILILAPLLLVPFNTIYANTIKDSVGLLEEAESAYQYVQVIEIADGSRYFVYNEGGGLQSFYNPDYVLSRMYYDYYNLLIYLLDGSDRKEVAIIGLAGGTISRQFDHYFRGELHIDGVEIDDKVIELSKKYFELENPSLTIHNADGHMFLKYSDKSYDLIIVDAYSNQMYIPWNMTTQEFWETVRDSLAEGGIAAINVNAISKDSDLLQGITNSMASVFQNTYLTKVGHAGSWNYMISASDKEIDFESLDNIEIDETLKVYRDDIVENTEKYIFSHDKPLFTNDWAPVETMTDKMLMEYLWQK